MGVMGSLVGIEWEHYKEDTGIYPACAWNGVQLGLQMDITMAKNVHINWDIIIYPASNDVYTMVYNHLVHLVHCSPK